MRLAPRTISTVPVRRLGRRAAVLAVLALSAVGVGVAGADPVSDQQQHVKQVAAQLDAISARIDQLDAEYNAAEDRQTVLAGEIASAETDVDALQRQLGALQGTLDKIAIDSYESGSSQLSPMFSDPAVYSDMAQRSALVHLSLDGGAGDVNQYKAVATQLSKRRTELTTAQKQSQAVLTVLGRKQAEATRLEAEYTTTYADAKAKLGDLLQQEEARRAADAAARAADAAARAQAQARQELAAPSTTSPAAPITPAPITPAVAAGNGRSAAGAAPRGSGAAAPTTTTVPASPKDGTAPPAAGSPPATTPPSAPPAAPAPPPPSSRASIVVAAAMSQLGVPYQFAAESPGKAFDCSGLTAWAWGRVGVTLPHFAASQYSDTPHVTRDQVQPGDLLFYDQPIGHVAIYIGNGQFVHAPHTGDVVRTGTVDWSTVVGISRPG